MSKGTTERSAVCSEGAHSFCSRVAVAALLAALSCATALVQVTYAQGSGKDATSRLLQGQVTDRSDRPIPDAIVYLKNTKTLVVRSFIADRDGAYRFPALSPNVDYEIYAEHKGKQSRVKTLSAFDSRSQPHINLKIDE